MYLLHDMLITYKIIISIILEPEAVTAQMPRIGGAHATHTLGLTD